MKLLEGRYRFAFVDAETALPYCPFLRKANTLGTLFREQVDLGSMQGAHVVYDWLETVERRCDGRARACADVVGAGFRRVIAPAD